jgi:hypothetical protein
VSLLARLLAFGGSAFLASSHFAVQYLPLDFLEVARLAYLVSAVLFLPCLLTRLLFRPPEEPAAE